MSQPEPELSQGTLDQLILKSLALDQMHGIGIVRRITQIAKGTFQGIHTERIANFESLH